MASNVMVEMWYKKMTADYVSQLTMLSEILESKKQASIKYVSEQIFNAHYGYKTERDLPWWITALELINNIPLSHDRVVLDNQMNTEPCEWIKCSDRLPTFDNCQHNRVLVIFDNGVIDTWNPLLIEQNCKSNGCRVTHWMPLPQPPKEGE